MSRLINNMIKDKSGRINPRRVIVIAAAGVLFSAASLWPGTQPALAGTNYTATQTSDWDGTGANPGYGDTCSSGSCSIGGGFNAGRLPVLTPPFPAWGAVRGVG